MCAPMRECVVLTRAGARSPAKSASMFAHGRMATQIDGAQALMATKAL